MKADTRATNYLDDAQAETAAAFAGLSEAQGPFGEGLAWCLGIVLCFAQLKLEGHQRQLRETAMKENKTNGP